MTPKDFRRVGITYDGSLRDNGTPFYVRCALAQLQERDPEWWSEGAPIPEVDVRSKGVDLLIHVDDGRDDLKVDGIPHPWAYWAIDTHLGLHTRIEKARQADHVFVAQWSAVHQFASAGIKAHWLPLACFPEFHPTAPSEAVKEFDVAFVGHVQDPATSSRLSFLDRMFREFPSSWLAYGYFHEDMAAQYHRARIGLNHSVRGELNMRFFELASVGVPQLCFPMEGLDLLGFNPWEHYIPYYTLDDAVEQTRTALRVPEALERMAGRALDLCRAEHTYKHRVQTLLSVLGGVK